MKPSEDREIRAGNGAASSLRPEIERRMRELNTVTGCDQAAVKLVCCGPRAIPVLTPFPIEGRPGAVHQTRQTAVEALGGLGAKDVLLQYLLLERRIEDSATRFAEQSVKNAAAALCALHPRTVLAAKPRFHQARRLPLAQAVAFDNLAEDMENCAFNHAALRHHLTTKAESEAAIMGLSRLVGSQRIAAPWRIG